MRFKTADLKKIIDVLEQEGLDTFEFAIGGQVQKGQGPQPVWLKFYVPNKEFIVMRDMAGYHAPAVRTKKPLE